MSCHKLEEAMQDAGYCSDPVTVGFHHFGKLGGSVTWMYAPSLKAYSWQCIESALNLNIGLGWLDRKTLIFLVIKAQYYIRLCCSSEAILREIGKDHKNP